MFSGNRIFYSAICVIFAFIIASEVRALEQPTGTVILTITGKVGESNSAQGAILDLAMLQKLPQRSFTTRTPWDKDPVQFKGPLLRDVLAAVKARICADGHPGSRADSAPQAVHVTLASR